MRVAVARIKLPNTIVEIVKDRQSVIRVMMDRYLNEKGKLRLEHLWYCHEGGRKSMTEEEAIKSAGSTFQKTNYMGKEWYRVDQVELDEPLPIIGAR